MMRSWASVTALTSAWLAACRSSRRCDPAHPHSTRQQSPVSQLPPARMEAPPGHGARRDVVSSGPARCNADSAPARAGGAALGASSGSGYDVPRPALSRPERPTVGAWDGQRARPLFPERSMFRSWLVLVLLALAPRPVAAAAPKAQWVAVTAPAFRAALTPLCEHRRAQGLRVTVVETSQVLSAEE